MNGGRKLTGTEDTVVAGLGSDPSLRAPPTESMRLPASLLIAGRYELLGLVGVGGMGTVYRARDAELDEVIALKVLRRELVDSPGMLDRFRREVKLARRVTHRNVARTFDIGEHMGERFLTMEFIEGESLGRLVEREGMLPIARAIELVSAVCGGLDAAHAASIVHRDLKPDNVLIATEGGRLVITDFGVARGSADMQPQQTLGLPVGTPAYMSPEQVEGVQDIDARTDIYALGAILYELLTGEVAWGGPSPYTVAAARLTMAPPDPRAKRNDLPDALAEIVLRCMARDRTARFAKVDDVLRALNDVAVTLDPLTGRTRVTRRMSSQPAREVEKLVAVLPFRNRGDAEDEYIADAMTEDMIDALTATKGLKVQPRAASMAAKGRDVDSRELGRELGVQVVVEGDLRKVGDVLRVSARLISVSDGFQLWTRRYERSVGEFLTIADEAANGIAESLTVRRFVPAREGLNEPTAVDLYLRGRHEYHQGWATNVARAVALFEDALKRAPSDPRILAAYALAQMRRLANDDTSEGAAHVALRAAERARAAAPASGEPLVALATYHLIMGDYWTAAREVNDALRRSPSLPDVHDLCGRILVEVGRPEEGIAFLERALLLEPRMYRARGDVARVSALLGDWSRADELSTGAPRDEAEHNFTWFLRARLAMWRGDLAWAEGARAQLPEGISALNGSVAAICDLIQSRTMPEPLVALVETLGRVTGRVRRRPIFYRQLKAEALAYVGDVDAAIAAIDDAASLGLIDLVWVDRCPLFDAFRDAKGFHDARARVAERAARVLEAFA